MGNIRKPLATHRARGLTLVEMLMATALTLIMFAAVAQIFGMMGGAMQDARATIELSGNLRSVTNHLQRDLDNLTVEVKPWVQPGSNQGYFEIIEGPDRDVDFAAVDVIDNTEYPASGQNGSVAGDADDILCFTAYSKDEPFVGLIQGHLRNDHLGSLPYKYWVDRSTPTQFTAITSQYAEIIYFTKHTQADDRNLFAWSSANRRDANETVTVYRRVLLVRPDIYFGDPRSMTPPTSHRLSYAEAMTYYDLSMWGSAPDQWITNSLEDLQNRNRRVAHHPLTASGMKIGEDAGGNTLTLDTGTVVFPYPLRPHAIFSFEQLNTSLEKMLKDGDITEVRRDRTGEDVILTRALAFDVKAFDPGTVVLQEKDPGTIAVQPGDIGYDPTDVGPAGDATTKYLNSDYMTGAFVDLNWGRSSTRGDQTSGSSFQYLPWGKSRLYNFGNLSTNLFGSSPLFQQNPSMANPSPASASMNYAYYDTWPFYYEVDGENQDAPATLPASYADTAPGLVDEGTNGFDDDTSGAGFGVVDDIGEYETSPPYPVPLRGISITVRAIEDGTRQVRQDTIMADFLPK